METDQLSSFHPRKPLRDDLSPISATATGQAIKGEMGDLVPNTKRALASGKGFKESATEPEWTVRAVRQRNAWSWEVVRHSNTGGLQENWTTVHLICFDLDSCTEQAVGPDGFIGTYQLHYSMNVLLAGKYPVKEENSFRCSEECLYSTGHFSSIGSGPWIQDQPKILPVSESGIIYQRYQDIELTQIMVFSCLILNRST